MLLVEPLTVPVLKTVEYPEGVVIWMFNESDQTADCGSGGGS